MARKQGYFRGASDRIFAEILTIALPRTAQATRFVMNERRVSAKWKRKRVIMTTRSRREHIIFKHSFRIKGIERELAAGTYEVVTDDEMIEGLSFPCFRRVATMIMVPAAAPHTASIEMISISPLDLSNAQDIDARAF